MLKCIYLCFSGAWLLEVKLLGVMMEDQVMKQRVKSMYGYALRQGACSLDEVPRFVMEILKEDTAQDAIDDLVSVVPALSDAVRSSDQSAGVV